MQVRLIKTTIKTEIFIVESDSCEKAIGELNQGKHTDVDVETNVAVEIGAYKDYVDESDLNVSV